MAAKIKVEHLDIVINNKTILHNINLEIQEGKITVLLGVNGSGKSTLLKAISNLITPKNGVIQVDGENISNMKATQRAKKMAILSQTQDTGLNMTVYELVEQGRYPHVGALKMLRKQDHAAIQQALETTGLNSLKDKSLMELSGGERQRAWLSLALAQSTDLLLLDEPTTFLDIHHQMVLLDLIKRLNKEENKTILMVLHDINHALKYADEVIVLKDREVYKIGEPKQVLDKQALEDVYRVKANIVLDEESNNWVCVPYDTV